MERPPRICVVSPLYHPSLGGVGRQAVALTEHLQGVGIPVFVICRKMKDMPEWQPVPGVEVIRLSSLNPRQINLQEMTFSNIMVSLSFSLCLVAALLRWSKRYDVVHFHGASLPLLCSVLPLKIMGKKILAKVAGAKMGIEAGSFRGRYLFLGNLFVLLLRQVDAFVAISEEIRADLLAEGYPEERVHRISNFVEEKIFFPPRSDEEKTAKKRALINTDRIVLTFSGRLVRTKRLDILLSSLRAVLALKEDVHLAIVGDGEMRESLELTAEELGLSGHVTFFGFVSNVAEYLHGTDIFVFPSEREGMPNALLEAMACRLPVIASDTEASSEIIRHNENGLLFRAGDAEDLTAALLRLLDNDVLRSSLAVRGYETVRSNYQLHDAAAKYVQLYERISRT